jgi:hypothetical protein
LDNKSRTVCQARFGTDQPWLSLLDPGDMVRYRRNSLSIGTVSGLLTAVMIALAARSGSLAF